MRKPPNGARRIAVFDVCGTLYDANTSRAFVDWLKLGDGAPEGGLARSRIASWPNALVYRLTGVDLFRRRYTRGLKGWRQDTIDSRANEFVKTFLSHKVRPEVRALLEGFRNEGIEIVLMSASYDVLIRHVAEYFGASAYHASSLEVANGVLTGRFESDLLGVKHHLLETAFDNVVELTVVTDNKSDLALLRKADKAYIVCSSDRAEAFWREVNLNNKVIIRPG